MKKLAYNTSAIKLREAICLALNQERGFDLENTHKHISWDLLKRETDQSSPLHKLYYQNFEAVVAPVWEQFVEEVIAPTMEEDFLYQKIPTFRVQLPNKVGVGEFHKDSKYGHQNGAMNLFIPFTKLNKENTVLVESIPGTDKYFPLLCEYGEYFVWDGVNLKHGNKQNNSDVTRVSIDARVVLGSVAESMPPAKSINMNTPLTEGGYYKRYTK